VWNGVLVELVEQAWEMGESELVLIHGHGCNRGITPGFVNTNTGFFGRSGRNPDKAVALPEPKKPLLEGRLCVTLMPIIRR
jgi:hypothetical protein